MKKHFLTGLVILLTSAVTLLATIFIVSLLTSPFQSMLESILRSYNLVDASFGIFSVSQMIMIISKIFVISLLFAFVIGIGFLCRLFIINTLLKFTDLILHRIPFINKIYKPLQDMIHIIFQSKKNAFSQVVLIPFPKISNEPGNHGYSLGFLSEQKSHYSPSENISVFLPCSPNPSVGYMMLYPYEDLIFLDLPVESAFKSIVSCGVMLDLSY